jgi:phosphoribosyl 1,2-cyclic phosphodiesterase
VVTEEVKENLRCCEVLILESNHDLDMLINGDYPWHLKQRIRSQVGHLSNEDAGRTLKEISEEGRLKKVYLAHLSQNNNRPEVAIETVRSYLKSLSSKNLELLLTWHHKMSKCIRI